MPDDDRPVTRRDLRLEIAAAAEAARIELRDAIAPLATKAELQEAIALLATKAELQEAIALLATKAELQAAVAPLATKRELRESEERTRRHFDMVAERLEGQIRLLAEGQIALRESMDSQFGEVRTAIAQLDRRVMVLEARAPH
jgi:hypothetical protein